MSHVEHQSKPYLAGNPPRHSERVVELDGLRGVALLMVLTWHYFHCQLDGVSTCKFVLRLRLLTAEFWSGVDLFFVLSGFLIGGILCDHVNSKSLLRTFWVRRFCRILPVYLMLLIAYGIAWALLERADYDWLFGTQCPDSYYILFLQNVWMAASGEWGGNFLAVTWSLAVEEQFYLVLPLLFIGFGSRYVGILATSCCLLAPILRSLSSPLGAYVLMFCRMDALFSGVVVALIVRTRWFNYVNVKDKVFASSLFLVALLAVVLDRRASFLGVFKYSFYSVLYAMLLLALYSMRGNVITGLFRARFLIVVGRYSFGLYMYHQAVVGILHGLILQSSPSIATSDGAGVTILALLMTTLLSVMSFHVVEQRFITFGHRFVYK
jgi:peptidoglycan/LPS O-acetylase OafA/YrhL